MFNALIVLMVSHVHLYTQTHQNIYVRYVQFFCISFSYISIGLGKRITVMTEIIHILTKCLASNKHSVMLIIDFFLFIDE